MASEDQQALSVFVGRGRQLLEMRTAEKNRLRTVDPSRAVRDSSEVAHLNCE